MILALSHDFMLRRNCQISADHGSNCFAISTHGSHHVRLINHIASLSNALVTKEKSATGKIPLLPELRIIESGEKFGLVASEYATSFKGLIDIKQEAKDEDILDIPEYDTSDVDALIHNLQIDPVLLTVPEHHPISSNSPPPVRPHPITEVPACPSTSSTPPIISRIQPTDPVGDSSTPTGNKRKALHAEDDPAAKPNTGDDVPAAKKARAGENTATRAAVSTAGLIVAEGVVNTMGLNVGNTAACVSPPCRNSNCYASLPFRFTQTPPTTIQAYFVGTKPAPPNSTAPKLGSSSTSEPVSNTVDTFDLSVPKGLEKLTKSQCLFTIATGINIRSLKIETDDEFFLFMTMCAERQWASFKMMPTKWAAETKAYNIRLESINAQQQIVTIAKNPRALLEKLVSVESDVLERIAKQDFECSSASQ